MEWVLAKTLLSLAAVLGLMIGVVFLLKKFVYGSGTQSSAQVDIRVMGSRSLSPKKSISVVRVMGKVLVVGLSEQGISLLTELDGDDATEGTGQDPMNGPRHDVRVIKSAPFLAYLGRSIAKLVSNNQKEGRNAGSGPKTAGPMEGVTQPAGKVLQRRRKVRSDYA
jgi:flagellar protein FliO/FliZ